MTNIPLIDVHPLMAPDASLEAKQHVSAQMLEAAETVGFLMVKNTGLSDAVRARAFEVARAFFAQPDRDKRAISIENSPCHRGYFGFGLENLDPDTQTTGDYKEGLKIGQDLSLSHPWVQQGLPLHGPNQWPDDAQFVQAMRDMYAALSDISQRLLSGLAIGLDLDENFFSAQFTTPMATLAPLHYPARNAQGFDSRSLSAGAHTDFGCLSLVVQDQIPGLEVYAKHGQWIEVPVIEDALVMNIGDMLQRWSNDRLRSTRHRVINRSTEDRYSMAFFYDPQHDAILEGIPTCVSEAAPFRYETMTALDYLLKRIRETFDYYG